MCEGCFTGENPTKEQCCKFTCDSTGWFNGNSCDEGTEKYPWGDCPSGKCSKKLCCSRRCKYPSCPDLDKCADKSPSKATQDWTAICSAAGMIVNMDGNKASCADRGEDDKCPLIHCCRERYGEWGSAPKKAGIDRTDFSGWKASLGGWVARK